MNNKLFINLFIVLTILPVTINSELNTSFNTAVQLTRKSNPANTGNIDSGFVRGEAEISGTKNEKLSGLLLVRAQSDFGLKKTSLEIRQAFFSLPVSTIKLTAGRWYESYSPGLYFGRYLFTSENDSTGSGRLDENYSIINGLNISTQLSEKYNTDLNFSCIANQPQMEDVSVAIRVMSNPVDFLTMNLGANIHALSADSEEHRISLSAVYKIIEGLRLMGEYGITDASNIKNNSWIMAGLDVPTAGILDQFRFEIEYKKERLNKEGDGDLGWMLALIKEVSGISFFLNIGADPNSFGSEDIKDIGMHFKIKTSF